MTAVFASRTRLLHDPAFADATAAMLIDRLRDVSRTDFGHALWIGGGDAQAIRSFKTIGDLSLLPFPVEGTIERFPFAEASLDLIVVNGTLNVINDLPGALIQMRRSLKEDGLFLCALAGGETLFELRDVLARVETQTFGGVSPRVHPMVDLQTFAALMQRAGFALPVVDGEVKPVYYRAITSLLRDIKNAGEGLQLVHTSKKFVGKKFWQAVEKEYRAHHAEGSGLMRASVEIIYGIGWAPSSSQQKPLRPGSAQTRLSDALGSTEISLPDRARPH